MEERVSDQSTLALSQLAAFCLTENRVCPMPVYWVRLWEMIKRADVDREVPLPLILEAWNETKHLDKMVCLVEQLQHAERNGTLDEAEIYLRALPLSRWLRS